MSVPDVLILAVVGGVLGLDTVSFPQAMLSRPIVAGTIGGAMLGHPSLGLLLGATLELFAVETLPFGASRYPEWGSSSLVGGALFASVPSSPAGSLVTSVLTALIVAWVGGWSMVPLRKLNAVWARSRHEAIARGSRRTIIGLQVGGLTADLMRGVLLTAGALFVFVPLQRTALAFWNPGPAGSRAVVAGMAAAVALGAAYKVFHAVPGFAWQFLFGLAAGVAAAAII